MTYVQQVWADNDASKPVSAARMNYIEAGLAAVANGGISGTGDITFESDADVSGAGDIIFKAGGVEHGRLRGSDGSLKFVSTVAVPQHQVPTDITPSGTRAFEVDTSGNVLIGANTFVPSRTGTADLYAPNFFYAVDKRTLYLNCLKIAQISDPPDLTLGRTGPDTGGFETTPTGVKAGNCLGQFHYMGWVTPQGGTPGVTTGGGWNGASVRLQAFATEDFIRVAGNWQQGGELRIQTTPKLSATPVDRLVVTDAGVLAMVSGGLTKTQAAVFGATGDVVSGGRVYAIGRIIAKQDSANGTSTTQVMLGDVGPGSEAGIAFHSNLNLRMYRVADDHLSCSGDLSARGAASQQVKIGAVGPSSEAGVLLGSSGTVNFYKSAADVGKTDDSFHVGTDFRHLGANLGFYNHATATQQTVTGSRGANAALASLLTALAATGLIVDSSS